MNAQWTIVIIGGSGLYAIDTLEGAEWHDVATPWGAPSDQILHGRLGPVELRLPPKPATSMDCFASRAAKFHVCQDKTP